MNIRSFAKITWTLDVLGCFPRGHVNFGYTNVNIGLVLINLYDKIKIDVLDSKNKQIIIECDNPKIPQTKNNNAQKNICFRAIKILQKEIPSFPKNDIKINIQKNIPLAGGLGGSSTNGVAVIKGLNKILNLKLAQKKIMNISASIGSDTIFFASGYKVALTKGRGEIIEKLPNLPQKIWLVLVLPGIEILSQDTYNGLEKINYKNCNQKIDNLKYRNYLKKLLLAKANVKELSMSLSNDMEKSPATFKKYPILREIKKNLIKNGCLGALMSGAGSTIFGVCESKIKAELVAKEIKKNYPDFKVLVTSTL